MKKKLVSNLDVIFIAINLIYFASIKAISIQSNQKFISLIENYIINENINGKNLSAAILLEKTKNLNSTEQQINNQNKTLKNDKNFFNFNPFIESKLEDIKLISSKFLGTVIPKHEESDEKIKINCLNFKLTSENYDIFKKLCNTTNLLELNMREAMQIKLYETLKGIDCNDESCRPGLGKCISNTQCQCNSGFVDNPDPYVNMFCSYKQKRQLIFFLTEFFAPIGLGHILHGRFLYGIIKCSVVVGLIMLDLFSKCVLLCGKERGTKCPNYFTFFYFAVIVLWQAFDITMIGFNKFREENNIPYIQVEI